MAHDPHDMFRQYFHKSLTWGYTDTAVAFDTVMFILDNLETLCTDTDILSNYFPNIFKVSSSYVFQLISFDMWMSSIRVHHFELIHLNKSYYEVKYKQSNDV